jgi:hypothetical protein
VTGAQPTKKRIGVAMDPDSSFDVPCAWPLAMGSARRAIGTGMGRAADAV